MSAGSADHGLVDLRSDTVTRPTAAMLAAMARADTGDDVYGEDPTVRALESRVAGMLGKEAGLFTVSGSLANLLGVRAWVRPGSELVCEASAHVVRAELGAHAAVSGVTTRTWSHPLGHADPALVSPLLSLDAGPYLVATAAVAVENTHNFAGGTVQPLPVLEELRGLTGDARVALHLDGARLWNASVASGVALSTYGGLVDTVSVCFSKGLGAPIGSLLAGPADVIAEARVWRKRLGAGWRQAGVLAAAALHAVDRHVERLADDHARAAWLAAALLGTAAPETNIVLLDLAGSGWAAPALVEAASADGVLLGALGPRQVRLVTHLDVDDAGVRRAADVLQRLLETAPEAPLLARHPAHGD